MVGRILERIIVAFVLAALAWVTQGTTADLRIVQQYLAQESCP